MNVLLTFDVEIWCNSWDTLDADFPASFERYVFGRSGRGAYALPKTLEILDAHGLRGVFFIEPLFAARFGIEPLATIIELVQGAGQEVQLHLHPEWSDEARPPLLPEVGGKRPLMSDYSVDEQRILINRGVELFREAGGPHPTAFRSGSFACNRDTFAAVANCGIHFDSSINPETPVSQPGAAVPEVAGYCEPFQLDDLTLIPMSSFLDGFSQARHAQIGACSAGELIQALKGAERNDWSIFVLLSHNFELMVPGKSRPDDIVVKRFEKVCRFLDENRSAMPTSGFLDLPRIPEPRGLDLPSVSKTATVIRYFEQGLRRIS